MKALLLVTLLFLAPLSRAEITIPLFESYVTDLTATLSINEIMQLEEKLTEFEKKKGSQVAVLIVPTTQPETIEQYSIRVAEAWKLGRKDIDDGALLLVAKNDKALRIEIGYGLEGVLPDAMTKRIIEEIIVPHFKEGQFADGIGAGIEAILRLIEGEPLPRAQSIHGTGDSVSTNARLDNFFPILIGLMVFGKLLQSLLGRLAGAVVTSLGVGFIGWLFFSSMVVAIFIAIFVFFMSLFQNAGRGIYRNGRGNWSNGGGMGSGGFRGGGGGGFGGGGASGRW